MRLLTAPGDAIVPEVEQQSNRRERQKSEKVASLLSSLMVQCFLTLQPLCATAAVGLLMTYHNDKPFTSEVLAQVANKVLMSFVVDAAHSAHTETRWLALAELKKGITHLCWGKVLPCYGKKPWDALLSTIRS